MFWPNYYQHIGALRTIPKVKKMRCLPSFTIENIPDNKTKPKKSQ